MNELAVELRTDSGKCFYRQIYEYIRNEIRAGKLLKDEKLPSTRFLAGYLQVARSTVETAYSQLLAEGYIQSRNAGREGGPMRGKKAGRRRWNLTFLLMPSA